jgi:hypothetical protein
MLLAALLEAEPAMRLLKSCSPFSVLLLIIGWAPADHWAAQLAAHDYRVAYLKDGEVWTAYLDGQGKAQITTTASRVEDYLLSPGLNYMAYTKILKYVDEPGIFEEGEEVPKRSLCSIVIMDLKRRKTMKEILPKDNWIYLAR